MNITTASRVADRIHSGTLFQTITAAITGRTAKTAYRGKGDRRGMTLMELIVALAISLIIFELLFYVYMQAYRSWDIGLVQGKVEDEARRAVQVVSREIRSAHIGTIVVADNAVSFESENVGKVFYLYSPEQSFNEYLHGEYIPTHTVQLRLLTAGTVLPENYGTGLVIAKELLPPPVTIFQKTGEGVSFSVGAHVRTYELTLNAQVYPRSYQ